MWKFAVVCMALVAFSAPALAQPTTPPPPPADQSDEPGTPGTPGTPGVNPGMVLLGLAGVGLAAWGISALVNKSDTPAVVAAAKQKPGSP